jgi:uncharacterized membrane protein
MGEDVREDPEAVAAAPPGPEAKTPPSGSAAPSGSDVTAEQPGLERVKFFSDGVFAIAITLLVLSLGLPKGTTQGNLAHGLGSIWPEYGAFAFTFLLIGLRWLTHLVQFRHIRSYDYMLLGLNLGLLLVVVFLPFASKVLADYPNSRAACILYGASMAVAGVVSTALWWHACRTPSIIDPDLDTYMQKNFLLRWLTLPVFFTIAVVVAAIVPNLWWARGVAFATPLVQIGFALHSWHKGYHNF